MAIQIKHAFTSLKGDGGDATLVRPSNWNALHTTSMATLSIVGRATAGVGVFEELPTSAFMIAALAATDKDSFLAAIGIGGFETGDVKFSINPSAPTGWISYATAYDGTLSKAGAGGTVLASAAAQPLYELIWNTISNSFCPVSTGRGGSATSDFNAGKTIAVPRFNSRTVVGAGVGTGLSGYSVGQYSGEESHQLTAAELAGHAHGNVLNDPGHFHYIMGRQQNVSSSGPGLIVGLQVSNGVVPNDIVVDTRGTGASISNAAAGGNAAHNNIQPYVAMWVKIKL